MYRPVILILPILAWCGSFALAQAPLDIRPDQKGWQEDPKLVKRILNSTARELWKYFPNRKLPPILVTAKGGPISLFERGENGEIRVKLDTGEAYWAQYAYQFAHEFCHILCNYDDDKSRSKWFEESLCEMASIYAIRRMAESWKTDPPYKGGENFCKSLAEYADQRIDVGKLPEGETFAQWFAREREALDGRPYQRDKNTVVAVMLLRVFEESPEHWEAVTWLNAVKSTPKQGFRQYLTDWQQHCPPEHQEFVRQLAARFGVALKDRGARSED